MTIRLRKYNLILFSLIIILSTVLSGCVNSAHSKEVLDISDRYRVPDDKQLILYTSHKEGVYLPIVREFEERTGIWVDVHTGGTTQLLDEVRRASEEGACDVMFGGGIESYEAERDLFLPYVTRENEYIDQRFRSSDGIWTPFTELPIVFVYNNKLIGENEAPKGWENLLKSPRFKGQIAFADPLNSGTGYTVLATLLQLTGENSEELIPGLLTQLNGKVLNSSGEVIPGVDNGTFLVGITLEETARQYMSEDNNISICYPQEGTSAVPDGCAIVKGAPHTYNAGLFIDFVTGRDTQNYAVEQFGRRSVRTDIEKDDGMQDFTVIELDIKRAACEEKEILDIWRKHTAEDAE